MTEFFKSEQEFEEWMKSMREIRYCPHCQDLKRVLQRLHDYCGPPNSKTYREWKKAMADAVELLKEGRS